MQTQTTATIDDGFDRKALKVIKQRFLQVNEARLTRTKSALDTHQQILLEPLAAAFSRQPPDAAGLRLTPDSLMRVVSDYTPSKLDLERGQRLARSFVYHREPNLRRRIHSLFLMGSCGTIAQSDSSDLDIWVCHHDDLDGDEQLLLRRKCDSISKWALQLGLEVHFFLMDADKFRVGEREGVSTEDCGSAQHYLLLDEFYRTSLLLAGRVPVWWLIPPDQEAHYDSIADTLRNKRFIRSGDTIDFGSIAHIPAGEFIGAGIWQLYKAIDSPYKSVIKLLLTEVYASEYPHVEPLSTTFKRAIYKKNLDIDELDPYVMMYRKLEHYLLARGEHKRLDLVRRCFYFKVGKAISKGPSQHTKSWQRELLERMVANWHWKKAQLINLDARPHWKVMRVLTEQKELVRELTNSYRFLLEFARRTQVTAVINGQDMTILGRKLYAAFERKAGKVEWVNPGIAPKLAEVALTFCQLPGSHNEQLAWAVVPAQINTRELEQAEPLRRSNDLISLLAWCHINGLIEADTRVYIVPGEHGVSEYELHNIVRAVRARLPQQRADGGGSGSESHERYLSPNRPTAMQLIINVGIDPMAQMRAKGLERLTNQTDSLVYSGLRENLVLAVEQVTVNSWGDVSTRSYRGAFALLQCLRDYLQLLPPQQQPDARRWIFAASAHCARERDCDAGRTIIPGHRRLLLQRHAPGRHALRAGNAARVLHAAMAGRAAVDSARAQLRRASRIARPRAAQIQPHCIGSQLPAWLAARSHCAIGACGLHQGDLSAPRKRFRCPGRCLRARRNGLAVQLHHTVSRRTNPAAAAASIHARRAISPGQRNRRVCRRHARCLAGNRCTAQHRILRSRIESGAGANRAAHGAVATRQSIF